MEIVRRVQSMREIVREARARGQRLGFVPTMGFLHEGHRELIRRARELADVTVVSIFVNPTQFGPGEDFERYPRDLTRDTDVCVAEGVDFLFTPQASELYPPGPSTWVEIPDLAARYEGASRPGHFRGVCTVVLKLFEVVRPHVAVFGQKDAQQALIVRRMSEDLLLGVEIEVAPTVRDERGLALSSRNAYLSAAEREAALSIPRALEAARHVLREGQSRAAEIALAAREVIESEAGMRVDYVDVVHPETLVPLEVVEGRALLLVAAFCGKIRLLDNVLLDRGGSR